MTPHKCTQCHDVFLHPDHLTLHQGRSHRPGPDYPAALEREEQWLNHVRRRVRGLLHAFPVLAAYFLFLVAAAEFEALHWALLPAPGFLGFAALLYHLGTTRHDPRTPGQTRHQR